MTVLLSQNVTLDECVRSNTAEKRGIVNKPIPAAIDAGRLLAVRVLEPIRAAFPDCRILSGFRCDALNEAVGGVERSQHVWGSRGAAVDLEAASVSNVDLGKWIQKNLPDWDQLIFEFTSENDRHAGWIHVSYVGEPGRNRRQVLHIPSRTKK